MSLGHTANARQRTKVKLCAVGKRFCNLLVQRIYVPPVNKDLKTISGFRSKGCGGGGLLLWVGELVK